MNLPRIAVVVSNDPWVAALQRHCADHGGARIVRMVLDPATLAEVDYDVVLATSKWAGLNDDLVERLHRNGRVLIGVFDGSREEERTRLAQLGVDWMLHDHDPVSTFIRAITSIAPLVAAPVAMAKRRDLGAAPVIGITGIAGAGRTELAIALAMAIARAHPGSVLLDADLRHASIAQRLQLSIEPGLADLLGSSVIEDLDIFPTVGSLRIVPGIVSPSVGTLHEARSLETIIGALRTLTPACVIDGGSDLEYRERSQSGAEIESALSMATMTTVVGEGTPVGITRLMAYGAELQQRLGTSTIRFVINRAPRDVHRRRELREEMLQLFPHAAVDVIAVDRAVCDAAWIGIPVPRSRFTKDVNLIAADLVSECALVTRGTQSHEQPALAGVAV